MFRSRLLPPSGGGGCGAGAYPLCGARFRAAAVRSVGFSLLRGASRIRTIGDGVCFAGSATVRAASDALGQRKPQTCGADRGAREGEGSREQKGRARGVAGRVEEQGHGGGARGLAHEARGGQHAARRAAACGRRGGDQDAVVGRLEESESPAAEGQAPHDVRGGGVCGQERQRAQAARHEQQSRAAQRAGMEPLGEQSGQRCDDRDHGGPRGHEQSGLHLAVPEVVLQAEGQGRDGQHLREVGADGGQDRDREDRDAEQVERQQRVLHAQLAADEEEARDEECREARSDQPRVEAVGVALDRGHQQSEREGVHRAVAPPEAAHGAPHRIVGQEAAAECERRQADRDVNGEEPRPRCGREDAGRERGAGDRSHGDHRGVEPHAAAQVAAGVDRADERGIDRRDGCGADALHRTRQHQHAERAGQRAA